MSAPLSEGESFMRVGFVLLIELAMAACTKAPASVGQLSSTDANAATDYEKWTCEQLTSENVRMSIAASVAEPDTSSTSNPKKDSPAADQADDAAITKAIEAKGCSLAREVASFADPPPKPRKAQRP